MDAPLNSTPQRATLFFDFDSTLVTVESLEVLMQSSLATLSIEEREERMVKIKEITDRGMSGELHISESLRLRLEMASPSFASLSTFLHGLESESLPQHENAQPSSPRLDRITPGLREVISQTRDRYPWVDIRILSAGPLCCIVPVAATVGISEDRCHGLNMNLSGDPYISAEDPVLKGKSFMIQSLLESGAISRPVIAVGDGATDMETRKQGASDYGIGFGVNVKRKPAQEMADVFVEDMAAFQAALFTYLDSIQ